MSKKKTLSLDEVFADDLQNEEFLKAERLLRPYGDLLVDIINRRSDLGLTQKDLAEKAGTYQSRVSKIESGEHDVRLSTIIQIAEALETELLVRLIPFEEKRAAQFSEKILAKLLGTALSADYRAYTGYTSQSQKPQVYTLDTDGIVKRESTPAEV